MSHQNILITGASSGFGLLTTRSLIERGHTVFATMREPEGRNRYAATNLTSHANKHSGTLYILELDVTSEESVARAVATALDQVGHIDAVVNNAGFGTGGLAEGFTTTQMQQVFDVNVFGVQRVNRAVLPSMRERKRGLLIHISSVLGRIVLPFCAPYTATKYALEALAESYRYELVGTGVDSTIVEPGGFGTNFAGAMSQPSDQDRLATYGPIAELPEKMWGGFMEQMSGESAPDPQLVADAIVELIETPGERPLRTVIDPMMGGEAPRAINQTTDAIQRQLLGHLGIPTLLP